MKSKFLLGTQKRWRFRLVRSTVAIATGVFPITTAITTRSRLLSPLPFALPPNRYDADRTQSNKESLLLFHSGIQFVDVFLSRYSRRVSTLFFFFFFFLPSFLSCCDIYIFWGLKKKAKEIFWSGGEMLRFFYPGVCGAPHCDVHLMMNSEPWKRNPSHLLSFTFYFYFFKYFYLFLMCVFSFSHLLGRCSAARPKRF